MFHLIKDKNFTRLCLAAFFMSSSLQLVWVVLPFIVKAMNGSDTEVGLCFMAQMGVYVFFCLLIGTINDKLNPKKVLVASSAAIILIMLGLLYTAYFGSRSALLFNPIVQLIFLMSMIGVTTAFFWPIMEGWISTGHEGAQLTRRLGFFNSTWASANTILPIIGGYLMEINYSLSLALAALLAIGCFASALTTKYIRRILPAGEIAVNDSVCQAFAPEKKRFVWMSRVALFATLLCVGILRSQLGILYKFELHFTEVIFGWSVSLLCLTTIIVFWLMGKRHYWHYNKVIYVLAQLSIICCFLTIIFTANLFLQLLAAGLSGICHSVIYSSHQYYGVSGGRKRSGLMAIHETLLGAGFASGSIFGGILSDAFGRRTPYWFGSGVIIASGLIQIILWFSVGKNGQSSSNANTSVLTSPTKNLPSL